MSAAAIPLSHTFLSSLEHSMESDMTSTPSPAQPTARSARRSRGTLAPSSVGTGRQTLLHSLHSEWIKLRTLRSTWITAGIALLITAGFGAAIVIGMDHLGRPDSWTQVVGGLQIGQIVVAVLGALAITGEYSSGQIRSSLAAVPRRGRLLLAKATVLSLFSFLLGALSIITAWVISVLVIGDAAGSLADTEYLGFVWGAGLAYAGTALLAMGLGFLLRSTAGAITAVFSLLFVIDIPLSLAVLKWEWINNIRAFEPLPLSGSVYDPFEHLVQWGQPGTQLFLEHWQACLGFAAWAILPVVLAAIVFSRRDA